MMTITSTPPAASSSNPHILVDPAWLDQIRETIIDPDVPVIDSHHHLWDRDYYPYLFPQFLADISSGHNIRKTVFVECHAMYRAGGSKYFAPVGETEFVNGIAAMSASGAYGQTQACAAIVGYADLRLGAAVQGVLEAHVQAGGGRFRGIRNSAAWDADEAIKGTVYRPPQGLLLDTHFRQGFARLAPMGLSFDAWLYHTQLDEVIDLARSFPDTLIVLDHIGSTLGIGPYAGQRDQIYGEWRKKIMQLSRLPNVVVKLSGLAMGVVGFNFHKQAMPPSSEQLAEAWRPYFETCIEAFGPERCMFASNFPVDKGGCSYPVLWNAFKRIAKTYSFDERTALFYNSAAAVYKI